MDLTPQIVAQVAAWVALQTGLPVGLPRVEQLERTEMAQVVPECRAALQRASLVQGHCPAAATYVRETGIVYVGARLSEPETRSWLAHEFVHRGQHAAGFPDPATSCAERRRQEAEAYAVQAAYNKAHRIEWMHEAPAIVCP